jgi:hypothetical protein
MNKNNINKIILIIIPLISGCFSLTYGSSAFHNINYYNSKSCDQYLINYGRLFSGPQPNAYDLRIVEKGNYKEYILRFYNINKYSISWILNKNIHHMTLSDYEKTNFVYYINLPSFNTGKDKLMLKCNDKTMEIPLKQEN